MLIARRELAMQFLLHRYSDVGLGILDPIQIAWLAEINIQVNFSLICYL
jgi:hypothetical protein